MADGTDVRAWLPYDALSARASVARPDEVLSPTGTGTR
jgi:hypothetical protein